MTVHPRIPPVVLLVSALSLQAPAAAQDVAPSWDDQIPAHVAVVDGPATLERDGVIETLALNTILVSGDRLRTDQGRAEVIYGDGTVLDIDAYSSVDMMSDTLMRLLEGRVKLTIARAARTAYRVDGAGGSAVMRVPGEYRVSTGDVQRAEPSIELVVYRGSAELVNALGTTLVRPGTYAVASVSNAPSLPYSTNSAAWDDFEGWANEQRDARLGYASSQYLPADLRYYGGALDRYGSWDYLDGYGDVWYPQVASTWYPYSHGSWTFVGRFGWTWVGADLWAWPTHHYGRWGHHGGRWFWIPGRHWSPAWVTWASAPGYIGWCPLGFDNRPIVSITSVSVNIGPRLGWSIVPASRWRPRVHVASAIVAHDRVGSDAWGQFAVRRDGPDYAVPRGQRAVTAATEPASVDPAPSARAIPRGSSRAAVATAPSRTPSAAQPRTGGAAPSRSTSTARARPGAAPATSPATGGSGARAASPPTRQPQRDAWSSPTPAARPNAVRRQQEPPPSPPDAAASTRPTPRSQRPDVVYYRGGASAAASASPSPSRRAFERSAPPDRPVAAPPSRAIRSVPLAPPPDRGVERSQPRISPQAPSSRVMRSAPSAPPPGRSVDTARPRISQPAPSSGAGRPSSPGVQRSAPPTRSAPPSAQPNRGGGRTAPSSSSGRGSARPRGGG
jgi:hypothetical protein